MALPFLYLAFTKILQLHRLKRQDGDDLAVEIVILRHEGHCCIERELALNQNGP